MADNARETANAEQEMLLRTWPRTKALVATVTTAGTPVTADLSALGLLGKTCFFKAVGGNVFGLTFQNGDTAPTLVEAEDWTIEDSKMEELYVWGDADLRLRLDASANGTKLFAFYDTTPL